MKRFLGKKIQDDGSKSAKGAQPENPYAQTASDQYTEDNTKFAGGMTRYQQARAGIETGSGPQGLNRNDSVSSSATAPPPYSDQAASAGYGNNRYGAAGGYASNSKYAGSSYSNAPRQGGYGGLGRTDSASTDANRDALFSGARDRHQQQGATANDNSGGNSGSGTPAGAAGGSKYGGYGEQRELNEEEREAEEYRNLKQQIHQTTQDSLATNQNSLRYMNQALETGLSTYARLGAQNERLHHTDQLLDTATESHRHAEAQTKKLKSLNRSMFAVHVKNPFTEKRRTAEEEAKILQQNQSDREIREATRRDKFAQHSRMERTFAGFDNPDLPSASSSSNRADRNKYALEDDSDEESKAQLDAANDQIERDLEQMSIGVARLKAVGKAMGDELDHGNKLIDRIGSKTDPLDDQIRVTNARMNRIR
ncbi:putative plasma membrane snare protein [Rosellinia necatrix]|uniref:Putative plasma membrane snare protein n=1 Tax=Rosellinia necatrix TaxID=77044 RepID=A0A1S7UMB0_ROSNE|nr:putative plasma membrane snare protein [Rosellinia necatrix]